MRQFGDTPFRVFGLWQGYRVRRKITLATSQGFAGTEAHERLKQIGLVPVGNRSTRRRCAGTPNAAAEYGYSEPLLLMQGRAVLPRQYTRSRIPA